MPKIIIVSLCITLSQSRINGDIDMSFGHPSEAPLLAKRDFNVICLMGVFEYCLMMQQIDAKSLAFKIKVALLHL